MQTKLTPKDKEPETIPVPAYVTAIQETGSVTGLIDGETKISPMKVAELEAIRDSELLSTEQKYKIIADVNLWMSTWISANGKRDENQAKKSVERCGLARPYLNSALQGHGLDRYYVSLAKFLINSPIDKIGQVKPKEKCSGLAYDRQLAMTDEEHLDSIPDGVAGQPAKAEAIQRRHFPEIRISDEIGKLKTDNLKRKKESESLEHALIRNPFDIEMVTSAVNKAAKLRGNLETLFTNNKIPDDYEILFDNADVALSTFISKLPHLCPVKFEDIDLDKIKIPSTPKSKKLLIKQAQRAVALVCACCAEKPDFKENKELEFLYSEIIKFHDELPEFLKPLSAEKTFEPDETPNAEEQITKPLEIMLAELEAKKPEKRNIIDSIAPNGRAKLLNKPYPQAGTRSGRG